METKILEDIGLTKNEVKVYLALLELGDTPAGPLIKKLGMHRAAVYNLLDLLIDKGIVSFILRLNKKYFQASGPDLLFEYIESEKQELEIKKEMLKKILPELKKIIRNSTEEQKGIIYAGKNGIKSIFEDIIKTKEQWSVFGAEGKFKEMFPIYFTHFHNKRTKNKIKLQIIYKEKVRGERREKELKICQIKYLPGSYISPSTTYIYGDKIAIIIWSPEPIAFLIKSKQVSDSYKSFFEILWRTAKD